MSHLTRFFQNNNQDKKSGQVKSLTQHVLYWQKLTKLIQPLLPQPENWQVACYQYGVLTLTGENQAMVSQLGYLQKHYIEKISQLSEFRELQKIHVRVRESATKPPISKTSKALPADAQQMLEHAAQLVNDPKLSQAIQRFASIKKHSDENER